MISTDLRKILKAVLNVYFFPLSGKLEEEEN